MRALIVLATMIALAAVPAWAQSDPNVQEMVKSLSPTPASGTLRGIRVVQKPELSLNVLFATGSAQLTPSAIQTLNDLGRALNDPSLTAYKFRIEGHTDTVGRSDYNKALSERRAASVLDYMVSTARVDRNRLQSVGMGEEGLLVATPPQTPEPRNRRVLVVNLGS